MAIPEYVIPLLSIAVPIAVLAIVRILDRGEKRREKIDLESDKVQSFMEVHKGHVDWLLRNVELLTNRMGKVEADLNRLLGRMNGR